MKKLVFVFMAMFAMSFASCDSCSTESEATANDSDSITVVDTTLVVDSLVEAVDSTSAE